MTINFKPTKLSGSVSAVPASSESHIKLICAAFSIGRVRNVPFTEDVCATLDALKSLGFVFDTVGDNVIFRTYHPNRMPIINCGSSVKTLIYFMCLACACIGNVVATFDGSDKLPKAAIEAFLKVLGAHGITSDYNGSLPFAIKGSLNSGEFTLDTEYAEDFVTGLLIALSRNNTDSFINVVGGDYPKSGILLAADILKEAKVLTASNEDVYIIRGGQSYKLFETTIGGDFALASNFVVANAMNSNVRVSGLDAMSAQPEKTVFEIIRRVQSSGCRGFDLNCLEIPNLVPILAVYACSLNGTTCLCNAKSRSSNSYVDTELVCDMINSVGGKATALSDRIVIDGVKNLTGGTIDCRSDYRIALASAILSTICTDDVTVLNVECVAKPYASFFDDFRRVGGNVTIIN